MAIWSWFCMKPTNACGRDTQGRRAAPVALPLVALALVEEAVLGGGDELLRRAFIVGVVSLAPARERDHRRVMKVVVPEAVEPVAENHPRVLRLVLADDDGRAPPRGAAHLARQRREKVLVRVVRDALRGVEAEAVEVELLDPVARVREEELADGRGVPAVEVDGGAPLGLVPFGEVVLRELREVVAVRPEVVVDHVEDDGDVLLMSFVDEAAQVVGLAVEPRRREEADAVVAPAEATREIGHRHQLDARHAQARKLFQLRRRRRERPFAREGADVQLVDDLPLERRALPLRVGPAERRRVYDARVAVRPFGLKAGRGVWV